MTSRDRWLAYLFVAPAILLVAVMMYYPMVGTFYESLFTTSFISPEPRFIGFASYTKTFGDPVFLQILLNSLEWTGFVVLFQNVAGFVVALVLNQNLPGQGLMRSLILLPWILPGVVAAIVWRFMCDPHFGLINSFLMGL